MTIEETNNEETNVETTVGEVAAEDRVLAKGDTPDFKWYVAHVLSGFEHRVTKTLKERIVNHKMAESFAEIFIPEEQVQTTVNGKKRNIKKKFFPGYVLIKMIMNERTWHLVQNTDKITGFIGGERGMPTPISDEEAAFMTNQAAEGFKRTASLHAFSEGDSVKVTEGPFTSFVGVVEQVGDKGKLKVQVSIFGRPTPVELDASQVEKVS